jgi:hypothetical protein
MPLSGLERPARRVWKRERSLRETNPVPLWNGMARNGEYKWTKEQCWLQRTRPEWADPNTRSRSGGVWLRNERATQHQGSGGWMGNAMELIRLAHETDFDGWRTAARRCARRASRRSARSGRWARGRASYGPAMRRLSRWMVRPSRSTYPRDFVELAQDVVCHRAEDRWGLLYSLLWRLMGEPTAQGRDGPGSRPRAGIAEERRPRPCTRCTPLSGSAKCRARRRRPSWPGSSPRTGWSELGPPFFARRFANMRFSILTPTAARIGTGAS